METENNLDSVFVDVLDDNNAQEVFRGLEGLEHERLTLASRWIWELIQNARDTTGVGNQLKIEIALDGNHLDFRHNGDLFSDREIAHLILHGSTKCDSQEIGRFGTGFICTHLISKRVRVRSSLEDGRPFDFWLNREGTSASDLRRAMQNSKVQFQESLLAKPSAVADPYTTQYTYPLSQEVKEVVLGGLEALKLSAAYIFAFNPMLHRLTVATADESLQLSRENLSPLRTNTHRMALRSNGQATVQWIVTTEASDVVAAIVADVGDAVPAVRLPTCVPRLFVAFPLNGTQNLSIPLVLNSELFVPRKERDGVFLGVGTDDANTQNMARFSTGCRRIVELVALAAEEKWLNASTLVHLQRPEKIAGVKMEWLQLQMRSVLIEGFRTTPLLRTISGKLLRPDAAWIPVGGEAASALDVWEASEHLVAAADRLPRREDQEAWAVGVESWLAFFSADERMPSEQWTVDRLSDYLAGLRSMAGVADALLPGNSALTWVNRIHAIICKAGRFETFSLKALVPNQCGDLTLLGRLYKDGGIDSDLKDIGELIDVRVRAELVDAGIDTPKIVSSLNVRTEEQVINQLLDMIRQRLQKDNSDVSICVANISLFAWLLKRGKTEKLDGFPVLTIPDSAGKRTTLVLRTKTPPADQPLAPFVMWPEAARPYSDLLPETVILDQRYAIACDDAMHWQTLAEAGFLHLDPLYEAESIVEQFLPDEPLSDEEQKARPRSEKAQLRTEIAWLSGTDRSLIDRARSSQARAVKLLRFCIDYILPADPHAFDVETVRCDNGVDHGFFRANWLGPLRTRPWVPLEKGKRVTPSAESLAKLLMGEQDLFKRFAEERVSQLLEKLGVSPADLVLRSVGRDDPERMSLIQSLAVITAATGNDAERVKALAGAIQKDPEVIRIVEERQARMERIQRNQALGYLAERLFIEAFKGSKLAVHRTGPGHDFRVEAESGEEEDAGQVEITGPAGSVLIEVKATTGTGVRMSVKQAEQAVRNKPSYFLSVVGTSDRTLDVEAFKAQARFVVDIGQRLENLWHDYRSMESTLSGFPKSDAGLTVELTGQDVRFRVDEDVWRSGLDFTSALELLKARLLPQ
jgi:hypothetical protein